MGTRNSNIDHHFKEKLGNYRYNAPKDIWNNIEYQLDNQDKTKQKSKFWYIAAASVVVFAISATLFTINRSNGIETNYQRISATNKIITEEKSTRSSENKEEIISVPSNIIAENKSTRKTKLTTLFEQSDSESTKTEVPKIIPRDILEKLIAKELPSFKKTLETFLVEKNHSHFNTAQINEPLAQNNNIKKATISNRWIIGADLAPTYSYRYLEGSTKNQESVAYFNEVENPVQAFSGGINIQYKALKRLTIQTGIYYAQMGQSIGNLVIYNNKSYDDAAPSIKDNYVNSYTLSNSIGNINVNSKYIVFDKTNIRVDINSENGLFFDENDPSLSKLDSRILQNFEYIDIPILFRYKLIDKKIDFNIIAGAGLSFLIGNQVYLVISDAESNIGKTNGVKEINYTGNIGIGIELPLINNLRFRLEPSFKYHLNALNTETEFKSHPYSFSLFSGFYISL